MYCYVCILIRILALDRLAGLVKLKKDGGAKAAPKEGRKNMKNVDMKVKDNKLTIVIDLAERLGASKSGKTILVASTEGNVSVPGFDDVKIGLNLYVPSAAK